MKKLSLKSGKACECPSHSECVCPRAFGASRSLASEVV